MKNFYYRTYTRSLALRARYLQIADPLWAVLFAGIALALGSYIFFTFSAIAEEFSYAKTAESIRVSEAHIATLETERATRSRMIDLDHAHALGFVDATPARYASLEKAKTALSR